MTPVEFRTSILTSFYTAMHQMTRDNFDHARFANMGPILPKTFQLPIHVSYMGFFLDNYESLARASALLGDEVSRSTFSRIILYRLLGHHHVVVKEGFAWPEEAAILATAQRYATGPSRLDIRGEEGALQHFEGVPCDSGTINLDCWVSNVAYTALKRHYYATHGNLAIGPKPGNIVIDAGACFGDTAVYFAKSAGPAGHVFSFDPMPSHGTAVRHNIDQNGLGDRITYVDQAVGDETNEVSNNAAFSRNKANPSFSLKSAGAGVPTTTIDSFRQTRHVPRIDFIKMDIEGHELAALRGAQTTIATDRPVLAISLYHRKQDLYEIPLWLAETFPFYGYYLDHYSMHQQETVLFAVPQESETPTR